MTSSFDEERRRILAAMKYIDDPNTEPFTLEGLGHLEVFMADMTRRAKTSSIIAGKPLLQEAVGGEAAFDFFERSHALLKATNMARAISILLESMLQQKAETVSISDLQRLFAEILLDATSKHKELSDFGSSIAHLMEKASKKKESQP